MRRIVFMGVWFVCAVASLVACSDDETAPSATSGDTGTGTATDTSVDNFGTGDCWGCVESACSASIGSCESDPECTGYLNCLLACPVGADGNADPACEAACPEGSGSAAQLAVEQLTVCRELGAGADCVECGVEGDCAYELPVLCQACSPAPEETQPCARCSQENCCETRAECLGDAPTDPECAAYGGCLADCYDSGASGCEVTCAGEHPLGEKPYLGHLACVLRYCAPETAECDPAERSDCDACLYETCAVEYTELITAPSGFILQACVGECAIGDEECDRTCYDAYPEALDVYGAFGECVINQCTDVC